MLSSGTGQALLLTWLVASLPVALVAGRVLRRSSLRYPIIRIPQQRRPEGAQVLPFRSRVGAAGPALPLVAAVAAGSHRRILPEGRGALTSKPCRRLLALLATSGVVVFGTVGSAAALGGLPGPAQAATASVIEALSPFSLPREQAAGQLPAGDAAGPPVGSRAGRPAPGSGGRGGPGTSGSPAFGRLAQPSGSSPRLAAGVGIAPPNLLSAPTEPLAPGSPMAGPPVPDAPLTDPPSTAPTSSGTQVTDPPASDPPATDPPVTSDPPATDPPASDPPASDPPASDPPASDPPASDPPASEPPVTDPPATQPSVTPPPDAAPTTDASSLPAPAPLAPTPTPPGG